MKIILFKVVYLTRVGGIAYEALNIYFFSWFGLISSIYTLHNFAFNRGYVGNSNNPTMVGWLALFTGSAVELVSAVDIKYNINPAAVSKTEVDWAISVGSISTIISGVILSAHFFKYKNIGYYIHGTQVQLFCGIFLVVWWCVGVSTLTASGSIGSVLGLGVVCITNGEDEDEEWREGSNMYFSLWLSFFSACWVVVKFRSTHIQDLKLQPMGSANVSRSNGNDHTDRSQQVIDLE